nr:putative disease resistance protein RGA1 [Arachis hypogaea]
MGNNGDTVIMAGVKVLKNANSHKVVKRKMRSRASKISVAVQGVIEDAEKNLKVRRVKSWFQGIKDLCYELIGVSEEFELLQPPKKSHFVGLRLLQRLKKGNREEASSIIRKFEALIEEGSKLHLSSTVPNEAEQLGSSSDPAPNEAEPEPLDLHSPAVPSNIIDEELMIGRDAEIQDLIRRLTKEYHRCICLVREEVGMGTTALARHVYNSTQVKSKFHFMAWVTVSQQFNVKRIVKSMLEFAPETPEKYAGNEFELLKLELHKFIKDRELLLVLEDVSHLDSNHLSDLMNVLRSSSSHSILIITRKKEVAQVAESTHTVVMTRLSPEACWSIIKHHAFGDDQDESSLEGSLGEVGRKIAEKCGGKPAVAKSFGVKLRGRSLGEWQQALMSGKLPEYDLTSCATLSENLYSRMSPALRQCLLYCSIFPTNHSIQVDELVKLWMAQGFIASHEEDKLEIQGGKYVKQLRDRSAFQESRDSGREGEGALKCKLKKEMHEFIQDLARNECRIMLPGEESGDNDAVTEPARYRHFTRHCTLYLEDQTSFLDSIDNGGKLKADKLHTLMVLSKFSDMDPTNLAKRLPRMKRIRALDLSDCPIEKLPSEATELLHLRYLNLSFNHKLKELPDAISNLLNLQTLNLNGCKSLQKLPESIGKLIKLRHLEILWTTSLSYLPKGIASLTLLRTLNRFFGSSGGASRGIACSLGDLENLNNIAGCLTIDGLGGETEISEATRADLKNKENLLGLELWFSIVGSKANDQVLLDSLEAPPQLQSLGIFDYGGSSFPNWMMELNKLTQLKLHRCSECNVLPTLGKLPFLESLEITNMPNVKMVGVEFLGIGLNHEDAVNEGSSPDAVAFPRLRKLHFKKLDEWKGWTGINVNGGDKKIMPQLSSLSVVNCKNY